MSEVFLFNFRDFQLGQEPIFCNRIIQGVISSLIWPCFIVARSGYILSTRKNLIILCSDYAICIRFPGSYFVSFNNVCIPEERHSNKHEVSNCQIFLTRLANSLTWCRMRQTILEMFPWQVSIQCLTRYKVHYFTFFVDNSPTFSWI